VGGACVSEKHAGFVVNLGGASFDDVRRVMDTYRRRCSPFWRDAGTEVKIIEN
jgi:UDP-N-acetylmuramate dehydrogenase